MLDEPLVLHNEVCEIIGTVCENPELLSNAKTMKDDLSLILL
jgi:hypothetical protein